eukprot:gnl/MRDRNA2_/MRDRNA2_123275_c0_seq1.p1 gnl/MRDRNA2_/MRDRNA2_123275_c0~~gnl/MRDRNA2_/MRDRNA2_123275_c0_seq1.p1  ORF type:complete len:575 (+),score=131.63 gnl/MRDRNA2_/MRDRNA2_123275_c0_seq1:169-1725(+)
MSPPRPISPTRAAQATSPPHPAQVNLESEIANLEHKLAIKEAEANRFEAVLTGPVRQIGTLELEEQRLSWQLERTTETVAVKASSLDMLERRAFDTSAAHELARDIKFLRAQYSELEDETGILRQDLAKAERHHDQKVAKMQLELRQELERQGQQLSRQRRQLDLCRGSREDLYNHQSELLQGIRQAEELKAQFASESAAHRTSEENAKQSWACERQSMNNDHEVSECRLADVEAENVLLAQQRDLVHQQIENEQRIAHSEAEEAQRSLMQARQAQQCFNQEFRKTSEHAAHNAQLSLALDDLQYSNNRKYGEILDGMQISKNQLEEYYGPKGQPWNGRVGQFQVELQSQQDFIRQGLTGAHEQAHTATDVLGTVLDELQVQQELLRKQLFSARGQLERAPQLSPPDPQERRSVELELLRHTKECIQQFQIEILQCKVKAAGSHAEANAIQAEIHEALRTQDQLQVQERSNDERLTSELKVLRHQLEILARERQNSQNNLQAALEELAGRRSRALLAT